MNRMISFPSSSASIGNPQTHFMSGSSLMQVDQSLGSRKLFVSTICQGKAKPLKNRKPLTVQARRDGGIASSASIFVGGFVLGGLFVGTLGAIYAPEISEVLVGEQRKELMRKLPKFIYDEEKALEKTRKVLVQKLEELHSAIGEISTQMHGNDAVKSAKSVKSVKSPKGEYRKPDDPADYYVV